MGAKNTVPQNDARPPRLLARAGRYPQAAATVVVLVSGGFDPLHVGHLRMIQAAHKIGRVEIALNSDAWLLRKKGYVFMPWAERCEILKALRGVSRVVAVDDEDGTVCSALIEIHPDYFANGGDRTAPNAREARACEALGIMQLFGIGGDKVQSSSSLVKRAKGKK